MNRELRTFRDHCRRMAGTSAAVNTGTRDRPEWAFPTDDERALWIRLADEIDTYLQGHLPESVPDDRDPSAEQVGFDFGELP